MALKAGRVGVHPSQVDSSGHIIGGESVDAYTKTEADKRFVSQSHLRANNKNFFFAYDSESGKYGYKLNSDGEFIPFSEGVTTGIHVANPVTELIILTDNVEIVSGGYEYLDTDYTSYLNVTLRATKSINVNTVIFSVDAYKNGFNLVRGKTSVDTGGNFRNSEQMAEGDIFTVRGFKSF